MKLAINFEDLYGQLRRTGFRFGGGPPDDRLSINIGTFITELLPYIFLVAGILLLLFLLYGGLTLMTAGGDPKKVEGAKSKITGALIGFVIIFISFWVVQIIARVLGIQSIIDIFG